MTRARTFGTRAQRRCALIAAIGVAATTCSFAVVRSDVHRLGRQRLDRPAAQALLGVQHFMASVDQVLATANGVVAASGIDPRRFTAVLAPDVQASSTLAGLALVVGNPGRSHVAARVGDTHLLDGRGRAALVATPSPSLVAFESRDHVSNLGFAERAAQGRAAVFLELALAAPTTPAVRFALVIPGAHSQLVVGNTTTLTGLTRSNQTVALGGRRLRLLVAREPSGALEASLPSLTLLTGIVLTLIAIALALALARRDETVRHLGDENVALDRALEQQRLVEAELRASQERFRAILRDSPDTIVLFDTGDGSCEILNRSGLFGHERGVVESAGGLLSIVDETERDDAEERFARMRELAPEQVFETSLRMRDSKSEMRHARLRFSALNLPDDEEFPRRLLGAISDVTEQRNAELREQELHEQLLRSQRLEALGQLAGGIAHDFNNLLAAIQASAELLAEDVPAGRPREYSDEIQSSAARGAALVRRLLTFAQRDRAELRVVDLNEVVAGMEPLLRRSLGEDVQLQITTSDCRANVVGDPSHLEQVILNLAVNARDAMPDGGVLWIAVAIDFDDDAPQNDRVVMSVTDTGTGIAPDIRDHIFEPFVTSKEPGKGTGLGLSTVHSIVTGMDGHIEVLSKVGEGTTIAVSLARCFDAAEIDDDSGPVHEIAGDGRRVLLVDDEGAVRQAVSRLLERLGFAVTVATNGGEALQATQQHAFDVVVTDAVMPGISGRALIRDLARSCPGLPVILVTGYSPEPDDEATETVQHLRKPFTSGQLIRALHIALDDTAIESIESTLT